LKFHCISLNFGSPVYLNLRYRHLHNVLGIFHDLHVNVGSYKAKRHVDMLTWSRDIANATSAYFLSRPQFAVISRISGPSIMQINEKCVSHSAKTSDHPYFLLGCLKLCILNVTVQNNRRTRRSVCYSADSTVRYVRFHSQTIIVASKCRYVDATSLHRAGLQTCI